METFIELLTEELPVTLEEVKAHLTIEHDDDDARLEALILAAVEEAEHETNIVSRPQRWTLTLSCFPRLVYFNQIPAEAVESVQYYDTDNVVQSITGDAYYFIKSQRSQSYLQPVARIWPSTYCRPDAVTVTYTTSANIPGLFKLAVCLRVASLNKDREGKGEVPEGVKRLWNSLRSKRGTM